MRIPGMIIKLAHPTLFVKGSGSIAGCEILLTIYFAKICQFCFNNIRNNGNGLCPACRRAYDDQSIEWKPVSAEESVGP